MNTGNNENNDTWQCPLDHITFQKENGNLPNMSSFPPLGIQEDYHVITIQPLEGSRIKLIHMPWQEN